MTKHARLTIVVENWIRELDAKLLLACFAVERGFSVRLGEKRELLVRLGSLKPSVFLNKDVSPLSGPRMARVLELGHLLAATDEEGLVYFSTAHYFQTKVGEDSFLQPDLLLAWGDENAHIWREHASYAGTPIVVTGNPRVDLLRPELRGYWAEEVDALRERFGRFVLVNTNFGQLNNLREGRSGERRILDEHARDPEAVEGFDFGLAKHRARLFEHFQVAVATLARAGPDAALVVRPHPSEDERVWQRAIEGCPNAMVLHEGNATPWLIAASAVVHNGCTTGLESHLLGTPAVAYQPVIEDRFDKHLPNALSHRATDLPGLVKLVNEAVGGDLPPDPDRSAEQRALLERWIAATSGVLAAERMADALMELAKERKGRKVPTRERFEARREDLRSLYKRMRTRIKKPELHRERAAYYSRVFPRLRVRDLESRIDRFRRELGRFDGVRVRARGRNLFEIEGR
jgi:surface carbohydrate biosynthesis protein